MAIIGLFTDDGMLKVIEAQNNAGFKIYPINFGVSEIAGDFLTTRDSANSQWYNAPISSASVIGQNTVVLVCDIPPGVVASVKEVNEIYIFAEDIFAADFLLAFGQPTVDISYDPAGRLKFNLQLTLDNVDLTDTFEFVFTQATEINEHNNDTNAHPVLQEVFNELYVDSKYSYVRDGIVLKGGSEFAYVENDFSWGSDIEVVNPFYGSSVIQANAISGLSDGDILYTTLYKPMTLLEDAGANGKVAVDDFSNFSNNDPVLVGDQNSVKVSGYVDGAVTTGTNEVQNIGFDAVPDGGSWNIQFNGQMTRSLSFTETTASIKDALEDLVSIDLVTVTGDYTAGFDVEFQGSLAKQNVPMMVIANNTLKIGIASVTVDVTETTPGVRDTMVIDDGAGNPLDLTDFISVKGAWIMRTNLAMAKGTVNTDPLKPDVNGDIDEEIFIIGVVSGNSVFLINGKEILNRWSYEESFIIDANKAFGDEISLPVDSRNSGNPKTYRNGRGRLQFILNGEVQNRQEISLQSFTPDSYVFSTGFVNVPNTVNLSKVQPEDIFRDQAGNDFPIKGSISNVSGSKRFRINSGEVVNVSDTCSIFRQDWKESGAENDLVNKVIAKRDIEANTIATVREEL